MVFNIGIHALLTFITAVVIMQSFEFNCYNDYIETWAHSEQRTMGNATWIKEIGKKLLWQP